MIISTNRDVSPAEFERLMKETNALLNRDAARRNDYYLHRNAQLLEDDVLREIKHAAVGTPFAGTIRKVSGQKFPDIVAAKNYGTEVKSSKDENWLTTGGSVNESTRIEDVERIFLTFGKLTTPVEFCTRPYEDCLSGIAVTHYPRYKIDMNLAAGETLFDRMGTTYDELRKSADPVGSVVRFYKSQMKDGERLWWAAGKGEENVVDVDELRIRLASSLSPQERQSITAEGIALFPEIFGRRQHKYEQFVLWAAAEHRVVSPSTRDFFSAGGRGTISAGETTFFGMPQIVLKIHLMKEAIRSILDEADETMLCKTWHVGAIEGNRVGQWIKLIVDQCEWFGCERFGSYRSDEVLKAIFEE